MGFLVYILNEQLVLESVLDRDFIKELFQVLGLYNDPVLLGYARLTLFLLADQQLPTVVRSIPWDQGLELLVKDFDRDPCAVGSIVHALSRDQYLMN